MAAIVVAFLLIPIAAGLAGAVLPALNWFPVLGRDTFGLTPFHDLVAMPGVGRSLWLAVFTGVLATVCSTLVALLLPGVLWGRRQFHWIRRYMAPILSLPHITVAVGIMFLLQPSGWLIRLISPVLTGWDRPPNLALVPDEQGLMLVLGLVAKEIPFLLLMMLAALGQIDSARLLAVSRSLGYGQMKSWVMIILPQLWPRMRLAVMIVFVFSLSVVDMAAVLAPSTPAPLALRTLEWYNDPDLGLRFMASASAVVQLLLALAGGAALVVLEYLVRWLFRRRVTSGNRGANLPAWAKLGEGLVVASAALPLLLALAGMASALIWSVAAVWRFPDAFPAVLTLRYWAGLGAGLGGIALNTLLLGAASSLVSLVLAVLWLERRPPGRLLEKLIFLPLLIPQIGFLFGLQVMLLWFGVDGHGLTILWVHCLYVFPYIWLTLAPQWRQWNPDWQRVAFSLGQRRWQCFLKVKLPMLLTPVLTSFAVGFSVSAALYLPTVFAGNARFQTLTVEAVTLASAAGRQSLGVATGLQMLLPLLVFIGAAAISRWRFRGLSGIS